MSKFWINENNEGYITYYLNYQGETGKCEGEIAVYNSQHDRYCSIDSTYTFATLYSPWILANNFDYDYNVYDEENIPITITPIN